MKLSEKSFLLTVSVYLESGSAKRGQSSVGAHFLLYIQKFFISAVSAHISWKTVLESGFACKLNKERTYFLQTMTENEKRSVVPLIVKSMMKIN